MWLSSRLLDMFVMIDKGVLLLVATHGGWLSAIEDSIKFPSTSVDLIEFVLMTICVRQ